VHNPQYHPASQPIDLSTLGASKSGKGTGTGKEGEIVGST